MPLLVDLQPAGRFLMEDFHRAGGLLAVLREVRDLLDPDALTVTGRPLVYYLEDDVQIWDPEVIRTRAEPLQPEAGIAVLYGSLAPDGAVIKPAAASPHLLPHRGRAVVFDSIEDFNARIDDPELDVDADSVLVPARLRPQGLPGHAEVANLPLPPKLLGAGRARHGPHLRRADERNRLRHGGAARLPEAAAGGPLGLVRTGDYVVLDVEARRLDIDVPAEELAARTPAPAATDAFAKPLARLAEPVRLHRPAGQHRRRPRLPRRRQRRPGHPRVALTVPLAAPL